MATIGLDRLYYAKITEASDGEETYGVPAPLAKAMTVEYRISGSRDNPQIQEVATPARPDGTSGEGGSTQKLKGSAPPVEH